jgi:hypothetical protein
MQAGWGLKICLAEQQLALLSLSASDGGRSSTVEPRIVVPVVAGSSPVGHPSQSDAQLALQFLSTEFGQPHYATERNPANPSVLE